LALLFGKGEISMHIWKCSVTTATVLLALSASGPASASLSVAWGLAKSRPDVPIVALLPSEPMLLAQANQSKKKEKSGKSKTQAQKAQGYQKSGNPKAAGGPQNPGKGKPQKPSDARPEQPVERPKPEGPVERPTPEQPVVLPQPEPRDKGGRG
jgi:hypothetical protein